MTDAVLATDNRATAAQTTANNAQASATQAQGTATGAAVTAAEAKCVATAAQTTATQARESATVAQTTADEAMKLARLGVEPVGSIKLFAGNVLPEGYLWCDGEAYSANGAYAKLFAAIGTIYNKSDDTAGSFRVPDMRGRVGVGKKAETFNMLGKLGGKEKYKLKADESGMPSHGHSMTFKNGVDGVVATQRGGTGGHIGYIAGIQISADIPKITNAIAVDAAKEHENMPPYLVCNYIIKY